MTVWSSMNICVCVLARPDIVVAVRILKWNMFVLLQKQEEMHHMCNNMSC